MTGGPLAGLPLGATMRVRNEIPFWYSANLSGDWLKHLLAKDIRRLKCSLIGHIVMDLEYIGVSALVRAGVIRVDSAAAMPNMMPATRW